LRNRVATSHPDGNLTDPDTRQEVRDLLVALAAWTYRVGVENEAAAEG
jgi:hypothetical protein